ncbi:MAG: carboxypeptidase regulatory-like domain-containing protein [Phycisphaerae bacterium]|nr:carboxypeptidase regulatory-like domain-containing protein [Gemmatimonadaceae bacterium]
MFIHAAVCVVVGIVAMAQLLHAQAIDIRDTPGQSVNQPSGRIRGVVFDSLLMKPLPRTTLLLMGAGRTATSDDKGQFNFEGVAAGQHTVALSTPAFDSLGLGTLGATVVVRDKEVTRVTVATPSLRTLWQYRCKGENILGSDSGMVWGTVRDAADDSLLAGAATAFEWYHMQPGTALGMRIDEVRKETRTDNSGTYFACGLPSDILISSEALSNNAASGRVEYSVGERRVQRVDLVISSDMVIPDSLSPRTREDSAYAQRARGRSVVRGTVFDKNGKPLANAIVGLANVDTTVRTSAGGRFQIDGLPAGTHALQVRRVGSPPATQLVDLRPGQTTDATVVLSNVNTLATVNVRATKVRGADGLDYDLRRKMGFGYAMEEKAIARRADMYSVLSNLPGIRVERSGFGVTAQMRQIGWGGYSCVPAVFLDGLPTPVEFATSLPTDKYRAVEVFPRGGTVPAQYYQPGGCGAVLFWTKQARW